MADTPAVPVETRIAIRDLTPGRIVDSTFAVLRKDQRTTRNGSPFLALEFADRSGRIRGTAFDDVPLLTRRFEVGDTVRVIGEVEEYRGRPQLLVRAIDRVEGGDAFDLVPGARRDAEDLDGYVQFLAQEIAEATMRGLVEDVFADARFRAGFRQAPMTVDGHHAYAGGALQHTVAVATTCRELVQLHDHLDEGIVGAASLLFACGVADAFTPGATLKLTDEGRLLGISHLTLRRVEGVGRRRRTPPERLTPLLHAVSGQRPRTPEAALVHGAAILDNQLAEALTLRRIEVAGS